MNKNEAESVIKETIEYANREIEKSKKKSRRNVIVTIFSMLVVITVGLMFFKLEMPVKYEDSIVTVDVPEDKGLDISVNLNNYSSAKGVLVKTSDSTYDLYLGFAQTLYTKTVESEDNLIRVGNGIIVDYNSDKLLGFMPGDSTAENIMNVYYIDNMSDSVMSMDNNELINYDNKTLVWTR